MNDRDEWRERESGKSVLSVGLEDDPCDCSSTRMLLALDYPQKLICQKNKKSKQM